MGGGDDPRPFWRVLLPAGVGGIIVTLRGLLVVVLRRVVVIVVGFSDNCRCCSCCCCWADRGCISFGKRKENDSALLVDTMNVGCWDNTCSIGIGRDDDSSSSWSLLVTNLILFVKSKNWECDHATLFFMTWPGPKHRNPARQQKRPDAQLPLQRTFLEMSSRLQVYFFGKYFGRLLSKCYPELKIFIKF